MHFEKDGHYHSVETNTVFSITQTDDMEGTWNFTGKIGEDKNKDHVVTRTTKHVRTVGTGTPSTTTWSGDDAPGSIMYVDRLSNKQVIFKYKGTTTSGNPSTTDTEEWEMTLEPK
jgi:hypothetical protein